MIGLDELERASREMLIRDFESLTPEILGGIDVMEIFVDGLDDAA